MGWDGVGRGRATRMQAFRNTETFKDAYPEWKPVEMLAPDYNLNQIRQFRMARRPEDARPVHPKAIFARNGQIVPNTAGMCGCFNMTSEAGSKTSWMTRKSGGSFRPNKFPGACQSCGCWVPAYAGVIVGHKNADGSVGWQVYC